MFGSRIRLAGLTAALALLVLAPSALADSASISVTNTAGQSDPAAGVARVFTVSGTADVPEKLWVRYRPAGGAACAPSAESDTGEWLYSYENVNGNFSEQSAITWDSPGDYTFCIWLAPEDDTVTTPITQAVTFRRPTGTISATLTPARPQPGQSATVSVIGSSEAPKRVYASAQSASIPCAPTQDSDPGSNVIYGDDANGTFNLQSTFSESEPGNYVLCLWLAGSDSDPSPVAGPQPIPFTVGSPAPSCRVPSYSTRSHLSTVERRIGRAHCTVGSISYRRSSRVKRGVVMGLTPGPGARLPSGTPVNVVVSTGHRRRHH